ncbi:hypothetical protein HPP92_001866 [Vanilla planifolia]|uniref:Era-type G domain-containing protein n=1 Tax=Vanilla planifolia TaxID=51239 RepID=A0A835RYT7_VANPL|nr:hypothetical protein HPP92_001866 [Vanilla planifolia]
MKALSAARRAISSSIFSSTPSGVACYLTSHSLARSYGTSHPDKAAASSEEDSSPDFDSRDFSLPSSSSTIPVSSSFDGGKQSQLWDETYRAKADRVLFGRVKPYRPLDKDDDEEKERANMLAKALLEAALMPPDDAEEKDMVVKEEDQKSLSVGIVGAPNAGKSSLTNFMVGTKIAAVSRKTNTTTHEILGVMTKGNTQICFFDTPGLMIGHHGYPYRTDVKVRVESAWSSINLYDLLIVIFDVSRHLTKYEGDKVN